MGAKKNNISQIDKYLKGQLDAKAMHQLERQAQDDPFLMDALEGFEKAGTDQQGALADLEAHLANRVAKKETRNILLWRVLPMAACLLLMLGGGYWFVNRPDKKVQYANNIQTDIKPKPQDTKAPGALKDSPNNAADNKVPEKAVAAPVISRSDKTEHIAKNIPAKETYTAENRLKRKASAEVDTLGTVIKQGNNAITAVKLNGKDFSGGSVNEALKKLPADVLEKIQIIDDPGEADKIAAPNRVYGNSKSVAVVKPSYKSGSFGSVINQPLVGPAPLPANKVVVSGIVLDAVTKEPLTGTTIGTAKGGGITQADINGKYTVTVDKGDVLTYNFVSYAPQSHKLTPGEATVNVNLTTDTKALGDVVVRGYVKRERDQTMGSSYVITGKEVQDNPIGNVEQLLQGKVAGLNIQNNTGAPGMRGSVNIRGLSAPGSVTDPSEKPFVVTLKVTDDNGSIAKNATISFGDWTGKIDQTGLFKTVSMGPVVISVGMPGYIAQFVKFTNKDTIATIALKKSKSNTCNENLAFKKQFEVNIAIAEKFTLGHYIGHAIPVKPEEFNAAIKFLARYTKVSIGTKTDARYKDINAFMGDKVKWLTWYEAKKCKGLK